MLYEGLGQRIYGWIEDVGKHIFNHELSEGPDNPTDRDILELPRILDEILNPAAMTWTHFSLGIFLNRS